MYNNNTLSIVIWDVNHGNAIFIRTPNNTTIVYDLGIGDISQDSANFSPLRHLNSRYKINQLDNVFISHPDLDHIEDISNLSLFYTRCICVPRLLPRNIIEEKKSTAENKYREEIFSQYLNLIDNYHHTVPFHENPLNQNNNGGVKFTTFSPAPNTETHKENNYSLVTILSYAGYKVMLTGDNESASWDYLLDDYSFRNEIKDIDVFLAPHHGRESGYSSDLFRFLLPKLTIISDGPSQNTSVTNKYSNNSSGLDVYDINKTVKRRYCLTTRKDGAILVKIGYNSWNSPFINTYLHN